jgi:hypothetical protein
VSCCIIHAPAISSDKDSPIAASASKYKIIEHPR